MTDMESDFSPPTGEATWRLDSADARFNWHRRVRAHTWFDARRKMQALLSASGLSDEHVEVVMEREP